MWIKWNVKLKKEEDSSNGDNTFVNMSAWLFASIITDTDRNNESAINGTVFDMSALKLPNTATALQKYVCLYW